MGIGWCAPVFSLETRLGEPALLTMSFLSPILGSTVQSLVYLEIVPSSPGRVMCFLIEALLLEMCTEERVYVLMYWEKVTKRLNRAFSGRCSCVCVRTLKSRCSPETVIFWHTVWNTIIWRQKMPKSISDYLYLLLLSTKMAKISWTSVWRTLILNIQAVQFGFGI